MTKQERHAAIRQRCRQAIADMYHNATPTYPCVDESEAEQFDAWFDGTREFEIDYLQSGGAYGHDYRRTLAHEANAGRYHSERARAYYIERGMRQMRAERERCNDLDSRTSPVNALWERIGDFGKLYQWGRGGRTLAPIDLVRQRGGSSFSLDESAAEDCSIADCVDKLRIVESFNRYVTDWCDSIPEQWQEYRANWLQERTDEAEAFAERD